MLKLHPAHTLYPCTHSAAPLDTLCSNPAHTSTPCNPDNGQFQKNHHPFRWLAHSAMYGGLDINTGAFTVAPGFSGVWTVTYTIVGDNNNCSPTNEAYLYINGQRMGESRYHSGGTGAWQDSTSSRTVYMTLKIGDTVTFRTASMCKNLLSISLCFELIQ